jgi:ribonuclease HI
MDNIVIYTDGACEVHKSRVSGWGAVLLYKDKIKEIYGGELNSTNNRAEIMACIMALKELKTTKIPIRIYSDSQLVIDTFEKEWYNKWIYNNWRSNKKEIKNKDLWKELIDLVSEQDDIIFRKVKGHNGDYYNERADYLADIGLQEMKKKFNIQ